MASTELIEHTKKCLGNTFVYYMKAHSYHWNVIGSDFPQLHDFFGDLYAELHGSIDDIAEQIRTLDSFAPSTLGRMIELADDIQEDEKIPQPAKMITNLIDANQKLYECIEKGYTMAENENEFSLSNFLQDRLTALAKHRWMLKALAGQKS
jgi:starvation-inducible DNA-binding protein